MLFLWCWSRRLGIALAFVFCGLSFGTAEAQVPLINGLGGTAGYGTQCLGQNDDGSSRSVDLTPVFPSGLRFFDQTHTTMFVNTNGNVTFSAQLPQFTPQAFPVARQPMIAPFWADVDIRTDQIECDLNDGGTGYAGDCHRPTTNGVWWNVDTAGQRVVVTWDRVGYYDCKTNRVMSFQLVLTPFNGGGCGAAGDFDVEFRFNRCEWNAGDASGGVDGLVQPGGTMMTIPCIFGFCPVDPLQMCVMDMCTAAGGMGTAAQAGFDAGNSMDFVEIAGSRTPEIHTVLCTMSNVGEPGIWRYQIRSGTVICPEAGEACDTGGQGVCAVGRTNCVGGGTECVPSVDPSPERCDALDNDCNGMVDEGDGICPRALEICVAGRCIERCFEGGCGSGEVCTEEGFCVDAGCEGMSCPEGQACRGGVCTDACAGVVCPRGQSCSGGRCVDLCASSTCDPTCSTCSEGACVPLCPDTPCPPGKECDSAGACVDAGCATMNCPPGQTCEAGACVDACAGVVCPGGDVCQNGECMPMSAPPPPDAGTQPDAGSSAEAGVDGSTPPPPTGGGGSSSRSSGCGCSTSPSPGDAALALLVGALLFLRRRRNG